MAVVSLQLGQCGNQIGHHLYTAILQDALAAKKHGQESYCELSTERFFSRMKGSLCPRTVLVDMENKVIQQSLEQSKAAKLWSYDDECIYSRRLGSGNNWGNGYCHYGSVVMDDVMGMVRRQVERCDHLGGFLVLMSVAGGTGSGVGSRLTELLRDEYPHAFSMNQVVWPYMSGEVIVQDFNTLLTLSHIYDASDAVLIVQNDSVHKICSHLLGMKNVSFDAMNGVICRSLASMLQPGAVSDGDPAATRGGGRAEDRFHFGDLLSHLVPHPHYRLLTLSSIPHTAAGSQAFTRYLWSGLLKHLHQMLITAAPTDQGMDWTTSVATTGQGPDVAGKRPQGRRRQTNKSISLALALRGTEVETADVSLFKNPALYSDSAAAGSPLVVARDSHKFCSYDKSISLLSNSQAVIEPLNLVCQRGWSKHTAKSYLHQYTKYGLEESEFSDAFLKAEHVLSLYQSL